MTKKLKTPFNGGHMPKKKKTDNLASSDFVSTDYPDGVMHVWTSTTGTGDTSGFVTLKAEPGEKMFYRSVPIDVRNLNVEDREVEVSFSSETDGVKRWFGTEVLSHKPGAVDLSRLKVGAHLFNHDPDKIIGPIREAWVEEGRGKAIVGYDETEEGNRALQRTKSKSLKGISVGYMPLKALALEEGQKWEGATRTIERKAGEEQIYIITKWAPIEISSTPIPADAEVGIGRTLEGIEMETLTPTKEFTDMDRTEIINAVREVIKEMPSAVSAEQVEAIVRKAMQEPTTAIGITVEQYKDLLARADAIGPHAVQQFTQMVADRKDFFSIQGELLKIAVGKPDAAGKTGPGVDGTGRDAQQVAARKIESMDDDYFIRMLTEPTHDMMQ